MTVHNRHTGNAPPRTKLEDLTLEARRTPPGFDSIIAYNRGSLATRIVRLAAIAYQEAIEADGFVVLDSAGPCAMGAKADPRGGFEVVMVGPTGRHGVYVDALSAQHAGRVVTPRVRVHWLGFLASNNVDVEEARGQADDADAFEREVDELKAGRKPSTSGHDLVAERRGHGPIVAVRIDSAFMSPKPVTLFGFATSLSGWDGPAFIVTDDVRYTPTPCSPMPETAGVVVRGTILDLRETEPAGGQR